MQCTAANRLLQRRCLLLISAWVSSIKAPDRPAVYSAALSALVAPSSDLCVQLTAIEALRQLIVDWDFDEQQFAPFLAPLLAHLPQLLQATASFDSQVCFVPVLWPGSFMNHTWRRGWRTCHSCRSCCRRRRRSTRRCVFAPGLLRVCVAVLLELTELAKPDAMPRRCCNTQTV